MKNLFLLLCGMALFMPNSAPAQDATDKNTVKVRFRLSGWDEASTDLHYRMKGKDEELTVYQDCRSIFYDYSGPALLILYRIKTDSKGDVVRETAAQADLTNAGTWPLILLVKNPEQPGNYIAIALKDDLTSFPPCSYLFSNSTQTIIGGLLGSENFVIRPGETTLAAILFKVSGNEKEPIYTNNWAIRPAMRTRVFVRASPDTPTGVVARRLVESTIFPPQTSSDDQTSR
jgi:hypothetical protein